MNAKEYNQKQSMLFPPHIRQLLPDDHLAVIISDIVDKMDLSTLYKKLSHEGNPAYHPAMMLKVLVYAYAVGIFSSRKIQKALQESLAFIFLAAWQKPDFRTISDFRKNNLAEIQELFVQLLKYCDSMKMISLGHISIDGTKIKANAADRHTWSKERIDKKIKALIDKANQTDSNEDSLHGPDRIGTEVPEHIQKQVDRIKELEKIREQLKPTGKSSSNMTDPDAGFMKTPNGITTCFNAEIAVEEQTKLIIAADVTTDAADIDQLIPMIEQVKSNVGKPEIVSADSGFSSGANINAVEEDGIDAYIPDREFQSSQRRPTKEEFFHKSKFIRDEAQDCFICPAGQKLFFSYLQKLKKGLRLRIYRCSASSGCPMRDQCTNSSQGRTISLSNYDGVLKKMSEKLSSEAGKLIYKKRQIIVEPVFATLKRAMGFTRFLLSGVQKVRGEFTLLCLAHNMRKVVGVLKSGTPQIAH